MPDTFFAGDHRQMFPLPPEPLAPTSAAMALAGRLALRHGPSPAPGSPTALGSKSMLPLGSCMALPHMAQVGSHMAQVGSHMAHMGQMGSPLNHMGTIAPASLFLLPSPPFDAPLVVPYPIPYVQTNYLVPGAAAHFPTAFLPSPSYNTHPLVAPHMHGLPAAASPSRGVVLVPGAMQVPMGAANGTVAMFPFMSLMEMAPLPMSPGTPAPRHDLRRDQSSPFASFAGDLSMVPPLLAVPTLSSGAAMVMRAPVAPPWCPLPAPDDTSVLTRATYGLPEDRLVVCNFNQLYKIDPPTFDVWLRILQRVPHAVLWLLRFPPPGEHNLRAWAAAVGIGPDRIVFSNVACKSEHVRRGCLADLCLDTLTCNGHTTGMDMLWSGTPVLTLPGDTLASRVAASLVTALGVPQLITASLADYEEQAVALLTDVPRLRALQETVRRQRRVAPLFNTPLLVRNLERAYTEMVAARRRGDRRHIVISKS
jgi:hypothetical protein